MASAIWGWHLEALFGTAIFALIKIGFLLGPGGPSLLIGLLAISVWQIRRIRQQLATQLLRARARRLVAKALRECLVVGFDGKAPRITKVFDTSIGYSFRLLMPPGLHQEAIEDRLPELEAALAIHEARVLPV